MILRINMSPYDGVAEENWAEVTRTLIDKHPLTPEVILDTTLGAWEKLWMTKVGGESGLPLRALNPPATVVGHFFEKLFTFELSKSFPALWASGQGSQKDLHCLVDDAHSIEIKTSGQLGYKIYGNRSYGQEAGTGIQKKNKSGYYLTVNFFADKITLVRFGWIDASDWRAQRAETGQAASLSQGVYMSKLVPIRGRYMLNAPVGILPMAGPKAVAELNSAGIFTIHHLIAAGDAMIPAAGRRLAVDARRMFSDIL